MMSSLTWNIIGTVAAALAFGIAAGILIHRKIQSHKRRRALENPFEVSYEPKEGVTRTKYLILTSNEKQYVPINLRVETLVNIKSLSVRFNGEGIPPQITGLDNWGWGRDKIAQKIHTSKSRDGNTWYWNHENYRTRYKGSRINLGIEIVANESFSGYLYVGLTNIEADDEKIRVGRQLSFEVKSK